MALRPLIADVLEVRGELDEALPPITRSSPRMALA
jgi:hypothetical protein